MRSSTDLFLKVVVLTPSSPRSKYRRSGNFSVKYTSPFNFCVVLFSSLEHTDEIKPRENFVHAYTCTFPIPRARDRIPCRAPLKRSWSLGSAPARECSRHPCRITGREGTAIGYLPQKISPVCLGPRFQLPSEVCFRDRALGLV